MKILIIQNLVIHKKSNKYTAGLRCISGKFEDANKPRIHVTLFYV